MHSTTTTVIEAEDMCTEMTVYMTAMPFNLKLKSPLQQRSLIGSNLRSGQETGLMHQNKPNPWTLHRNSICSQHLCAKHLKTTRGLVSVPIWMTAVLAAPGKTTQDWAGGFNGVLFKESLKNTKTNHKNRN